MDIPKPSITIEKVAITTKTRKLQANWNIVDWSDEIRIVPHNKIPLALVIDNAIFYPTVFIDMVNWCIDTFKYDPVLLKNVLQFNSEKDLNWFLLKWT